MGGGAFKKEGMLLTDGWCFLIGGTERWCFFRKRGVLLTDRWCFLVGGAFDRGVVLFLERGGAFDRGVVLF